MAGLPHDNRGRWPRQSAEGRFWAKVNKTVGGCWLWAGSIRADGYGAFVGGKDTYAHRFSYRIHYGDIPAGLEIDHLCRVRHCVNPDHLEAVTSGENTRRGDNYLRDKTHCGRGHEFNAANTYFRHGHRICRVCNLERKRQRWAATAHLRQSTPRRLMTEEERERLPRLQRAKTHCPKGHPYTPDNIRAHKRGYRTCKACHRESERRRRHGK